MYPCTSHAAKAAFPDDLVSDIGFGWPQRTFRFDSRCFRRPRLIGPVVAAAHVTRDQTASLRLFPVLRAAYPASAVSDFEQSVVPALRRWLQEHTTRPVTHVLGYETLIVEWLGSSHALHALRYL